MTAIVLAPEMTVKERAENARLAAKLSTKADTPPDVVVPFFSHRITFSAAYSGPLDASRDGELIRKVTRWIPLDDIPDSERMAADYNQRVMALSWNRFSEACATNQAMPADILTALSKHVTSFLQRRADECHRRLHSLGPAGVEVIHGTARQVQDVRSLLHRYESLVGRWSAPEATGPARDPLQHATRVNLYWRTLFGPFFAQACSLLPWDPDSDMALVAAKASHDPVIRDLLAKAHAHSSAAAGLPAFPATATAPVGAGAAAASSSSAVTPSPGAAGGPRKPPRAAPAAPAPVAGSAVGPGSGRPFLGIPVSPDIIGTLAITGGTLLANPQCRECRGPHNAWECPTVYIRHTGVPPPGFLASGARDPAAWAGGSITPAARAAWPAYITAHRLHRSKHAVADPAF